MKVLQVNTVAHGVSPVATIMRQINAAAHAAGVDSHMVCGYGDGAGCDMVMSGSFGRLHAALSARLCGNDGFGCKASTRRLVRYIQSLQPDLVHLHNAHGYYLNLPMLRKYLKDNNIPLVVTLHDDWWLTGRCAVPDGAECQRWVDRKCSDCPHLNIYPAVWRKTAPRYKDWDGIFFVSPSHHAGRKFNAEVIPNGTDIRPTTPTLGRKPFALAVANKWTPGKDFITLANVARNLQMPVVVVGNLCGNVLAENMIHAGMNLSQSALAQLYTDASVLISTSRSESYGMVVAEAIACGTPAVVRAGTAAQEILGADDGFALDFKEMDATIKAINKTSNMTPGGGNIRSVADMTDAYLKLYERVGGNLSML